MSNKVSPQASGQQPKGGGKGQQASGQQPKRGPIQEQAKTWMASPGSLPGCPEGLECLAQMDGLIVKQDFELYEYLNGWETENSYKILNKKGKQVYFAKEKSDCLMRQCCGPDRSFQIEIFDGSGREVIRIIREFKCCAGWWWCACSAYCAFAVTIEAPPGSPVGYVRQECSPWRPKYSLHTIDDEVLARVHGPACVWKDPCCGDIEFHLMSADDSVTIGTIAKHWTGDRRELYTDADTFLLVFPEDMDVRLKAVMMGALFLIDFMYFETGPKCGDTKRRR